MWTRCTHILCCHKTVTWDMVLALVNAYHYCQTVSADCYLQTGASFTTSHASFHSLIHSGSTELSIDRQTDRYIYLYSAYKSKESLSASVAKEMCFQRSSERIEGKSRPPQSGWKIVSQSRTGCRETPDAKFVVCSASISVASRWLMLQNCLNTILYMATLYNYRTTNSHTCSVNWLTWQTE